MPRGKNNNGLPNAGCFKAGDPKLKVKTPEHRAAISAGQKKAWQTKRQRIPIGSKWIDAKGYVRVKAVAGKGRWRLEHVMVMEEKIGRALTKKEVVHHIDGDRSNNPPSNLFLCRDHRHHMEVERQIKETFRHLLSIGVVTFSEFLGAYVCH